MSICVTAIGHLRDVVHPQRIIHHQHGRCGACDGGVQRVPHTCHTPGCPAVSSDHSRALPRPRPGSALAQVSPQARRPNFQAGHAGSIPVIRSHSKGQVRSGFRSPAFRRFVARRGRRAISVPLGAHSLTPRPPSLDCRAPPPARFPPARQVRPRSLDDGHLYGSRLQS
jgi:hypothetical protein